MLLPPPRSTLFPYTTLFRSVIVLSMGLLSSIIDNVPLVAATQGMYDLNHYPTDHYFWEFIAYATGTGGSALIDRKSTRLNSSHGYISYAVFCLKKKKEIKKS